MMAGSTVAWRRFQAGQGRAPWTVENGMPTPTLKTRRKTILEHFAPRIEAVYSQGPAKAHAV